MNKKHYLNEIEIDKTYARGTKGKTVEKIQEWLCYWGFFHPTWGISTAVDGDYGPSTEACVKAYQSKKGITANGQVTKAAYKSMAAPLVDAFTKKLNNQRHRSLITEVAELHLRNKPIELVVKGKGNCGPWVRSYMDKNEGDEWPWCVGFVQTVLDQALSKIGIDFKQIVPHTYSCDVMGTHALDNGKLLRFNKVRENPDAIGPGDIFLVRRTAIDWIHTGLVVGREGDNFLTIEGNTNEGGSRNGYAVLKRRRNFRQSALEIIKVDL